jgi:hypothetical protein
MWMPRLKNSVRWAYEWLASVNDHLRGAGFTTWLVDEADVVKEPLPGPMYVIRDSELRVLQTALDQYIPREDRSSGDLACFGESDRI